MDMITMMRETKERLDLEIAALEKYVATHKEGNLQIQRDGKAYKWYQKLNKSGGKRVYIPKANRKLAEILALNTYREAQLAERKLQVRAIEQYMKVMEPIGIRTPQQLMRNSEFQQLLAKSIPDIEKDAIKWLSEPYEKNEKWPQGKTIRSRTGEMVRSKSEAVIVDTLSSACIPYRYEAAHRIDGQVWYPDFTILHPRTGEIFLWEHFGLINNPRYEEECYRKLHKYISNGWTPGKNLIITFESSDHPLDPAWVIMIIQYHFL